MRRIMFGGLALALGLAAGRAGAQEVQWRPASGTTATRPAVTLQTPVPAGAPTLQPASFTESSVVRAKIDEPQPPQPLPAGPSLKADAIPNSTKPALKEQPPSASAESWDGVVSRWAGLPDGSMPANVPPGAVQVYPGGDCGDGPCGDDCGWCGAACGWLRNHCGGMFRRGDACPDWCGDGSCPPRSKFWVRGEYLLWTVKDAPNPPLVTVNRTPGSDPNFATPGTFAAIGGRGDDFNIRSGGRFTLGFDLPCTCGWGFETTYFFLADRTHGSTIASDGSFSVGRPFIEANPGFYTVGGVVTPQDPRRAQLVAKAGVVRGSVNVESGNELWGLEANLRRNICCGCNYKLDFLGGFRYLQLDERLDIRENLTVLGTDALRPGGTLSVLDSFATRNEFYGGQIGLDGEWRWRRWFFGASAKLAMGEMHQVVIIDGNTTGSNFAPQRGGLLTQPTNIGRYGNDTFAIVPEAGIKVGYNFTDHLRGYVGYDVLYVSSVVRPGDQVDTVVNSSYIPPRGSVVGPALPRFQFRQTDFWAQGVNFGLEWRY